MVLVGGGINFHNLKVGPIITLGTRDKLVVPAPFVDFKLKHLACAVEGGIVCGDWAWEEI